MAFNASTKIKSVLALLISILAITFSSFKHIPFQNNKLSVITWDGYGYYLYLPSVFIYDDISELKFKDDIQEKYNPTGSFYQAYKNENTGKYVFKYTCGMSILWLPFFGIAHYIAPIAECDVDGMSNPYQLAILIASLFYAFVGLFFLRKVMLNFFSELISSLVLIIVALGTNYFNQAAHSSAMSHTGSFAIFCIVIYLTVFKLNYEKPKLLWFLLTGLLIGFCTLIRPTNIILGIFPLLYGVGNINEIRFRFQNIITNPALIFLVVTGFIIALLPQLIYWKMQTNQWLYFSYEKEEGFQFFKPFLMEVLFSYRKGWLLYTPVMIFGIVGLYSVFKNNRKVFVPLILFFVLNLWIISSWKTWWYGGNFGQRPFIESYSVMALSLGYFLKDVVAMRYVVIKIPVFLVIAFFIMLNQFQSWQYITGMYSTDNMNKAYYWRIFSKTQLDDGDKDLLTEQVVEKKNAELTDTDIADKKVIFRLDERFQMNPEDLYSKGLNEKIQNMPLADFDFISADATIKCSQNLKASVVISIERDGVVYSYLSVESEKLNCKINEWCILKANLPIPKNSEKSDIVKAYVYNLTGGIVEVEKLEAILVKKK